MFLRKKKYMVLKDDSAPSSKPAGTMEKAETGKKISIAEKHEYLAPRPATCAVCNRAIERNEEYIVILKHNEKQGDVLASREMVLVCSEECYKDFELYYVVKSSKKMIRILG
jgi:hypothetical protein